MRCKGKYTICIDNWITSQYSTVLTPEGNFLVTQ